MEAMRMHTKSGSSKILLAAILLTACLHPGGRPGRAYAQNPRASSSPLQYGPAKELCKLKDALINESSGIAASNRNANAFWTNNDSGDSPRLFLFNKNGETIAIANIKGASAVDWEDIASFKTGKESRVLIADTGDNARRRKDYVLYVIQEPMINPGSENGGAFSIAAEPLLTIHFSYEDGSHDCEAVGVDPTESTVYLVSKELEECKIYSLPIPSEGSTKPNIAKAIATLKIPFATAMDISPDGMRGVILTYGDAYEFSRANGETWAQAFVREPRILKMPARKQGESICYGVDGRTLYLTSEGISEPLWEIPVENAR
jgi:hypothetical protein